MLSSVAPVLLFVLSSFWRRFFLCLYSKETFWKLLVAGLKGNWSEERWPWNVEALQISTPPPPPPPLFLSEFELLRAQSCCSLFTDEDQKKGWLMTCLSFLPHMPALLMTSLIQTAGHKMAAFTVNFRGSQTSNFDKRDPPKIERKLLCVCFVMMMPVQRLRFGCVAWCPRMWVDIIIRNKLRPTREHGSILLYVHGNHKTR